MPEAMEPRDAPGDAPSVGTGAPQGIGGWLVLMGIGLVLLPFRLLGSLAGALQVLEPETWRRLTTPSSPVYHPAWGPVILAEFLANAIFLGGAGVLLYLFFKKRRAFPKVAIGFMVANVIFQMFEVAMGRIVLPGTPADKEIGQLMLAVVSGAIWISYLKLSRRVAATFVT